MAGRQKRFRPIQICYRAAPAVWSSIALSEVNCIEICAELANVNSFLSKFGPVCAKTTILMAALLVFVFMGTGAPLIQAFTSDGSRTWMPMAGLEAVPSDEYYSMEVVASVIHSRNIPLTESQAEAVLPQWERKRFSSLSTAAAFSLYFDDIRKALLSSLVVTSVLYFLIPIVGFWLLTGNALSGLLPAILYFLWPSIWSTLANMDPWLADGRFLHWLSEAFERVERLVFYISEVRKPEYVSQTLRFPFPGIGFLHLTLFYFSLVALIAKVSVFRIVVLVFACYLVLFTYQPILIVSCFSLFALFCVCLVHRKPRVSLVYLVLGCSMLLYLLITGYREGVVADMQSHAVVAKLIGDGVGAVTFEISLQDIWQVLINRYSLSGVLCLAIVWRHPLLRYFVLGALLTCLLIKASSLFDLLPNTYGRRLERRGVDPLWMLSIGVSLWYGFTRLVEGLRSVRLRRGARVAGVLAVFALFAFPALSFWAYASNKDVAESYTIPNEQWGMIRWLDLNVTVVDKVVARSWLDIHYIRIFSGKETSFASIMNSGRSSDEEIHAYIASLKALGFSSEYVIEQFRRSASAYRDHRKDYLQYRSAPEGMTHPMTFRSPPDRFEAAWLHSSLMRPKWFPEALGATKLTNGSDSQVSDEFLKRVGEVYDAEPTALEDFNRQGRVFFVLRRSDESEETGNAVWRGCTEAFVNRSYRIFRC